MYTTSIRTSIYVIFIKSEYLKPAADCTIIADSGLTVIF